MNDSVTTVELLSQCHNGSEEAAAILCRRFSRQLLRLAEQNIGAKLKSRLDPEDITQTVFRTFFRRTQKR
jgi:hypothetical protein